MIRESDAFVTKQHAQLLRSSLGRDIRARTALSHVPLHRAVALRQCAAVRRAEANGGLGARFLPSRAQIVDKYANQQVFCGKFSKAGGLFMSACQDRHIRLYDTASWRLVKDIIAHDVGWSIISVDYAPDDRWVIYSSWSPNLHLYNTRGPPTYEPLHFLPDTERFCLFSSEFSPNSTEILAGSSDHRVYLFDLERKERTHAIRVHGDDVNSICWLDQSGQLFASGSDDRLVLVWDRRLVPATGNGSRGCVGAFIGHTRGITCVSARGDGRHLLSNGKDHCAKLWDVRAARPLSEVRNMLDTLPRTYEDYRMTTRPRRNAEPPMRHVLDNSLMTYRGHRVFRTLLRAHFSPLESTGSRYIIAGSDDGSVYIYETLTGDVAAVLGGPSAAADGGAGEHTALVRDVSWHPFKPEIVTTAWDGTCRLWTFAQHHELDRKHAHDDYAFKVQSRALGDDDEE
jgi:WD repeat-containing protein 23